ncbi:LOW QUALITY PROTEIN: hypothetical protein V2J09_005401 [Rumex salicifolius]
MAEAAMFSFAARLLATITSPVFKKAYERACSVKSAREDLRNLETSIETIQAVLVDAEMRQDSSAAIKNWIKRVREVLYDADDLFDEVATDDMLREEVSGNKVMKKVRAFISPSLNPTVSDNSIAKKVKDIRKSLLEISEDMKAFDFVECLDERPSGGKRRGQDPGVLFLDSEKVIGRDKDKKTVIKVILTESNLQKKIKEKMKDVKLLLVLDDVWWFVARRKQTDCYYEIQISCGVNGCNKNSYLFKSIVGFTPEQEKDPRWTNLGREILNKCANVPLAVKCIASLLFEKNTIRLAMAEALFGVASKLLNAQKDLKKLEASIGTIHAVLLDAEKKQDSSAAVKNWIKRVRDVLYDADDLFDEVATDDMLGKLTNRGSKHMKKVRDFFSSSNPIVSNNSIAERVKDIRKRFLEISEDMRAFQFEKRSDESPIGGMRKGQDPGLLFIDSEKVIGRDKDKKAILEMLVAESSTDVSVIVVVGIGGMGKTTLAQLVYKDDEVQRTFGENKWFVCISDTSVDKEVIGKICQSTCGVEKYEDLSIIDLQNRIREKMKGRKFLLVLDDVWDDSSDRWDARMDIWRRGAKGSKVIVTTRSRSVAKAVGASETYHLRGLSEEQSWDLFKRVARITPEKERDSRWNDLGREFVRKGANVPLAIRSIASLLAEKNTIEEWELFRNNELPKLGQTQENGIMPVLRLSYDHLASHLKPCFAYCSLFPKDNIFNKDDLIDLWASQGYIKTTNDSQRIEDMDDSWADPHPLRLRSFLYKGGYGSSCKLTLEKQFANFKCLRALKLSSLSIEIVPSSIGELKHLRYLDVSYNKFKRLPDAITNLVNLCILNVSGCFELEVLPNQFSKLVNLRGLLNRGCGLNHMPLCFDRLVSLQRLDEFIVSRKTDGGQGSNLHELPGLELRNELSIIFKDETVNLDGVDSWKLSPYLQFLVIEHYRGIKMPNWGNGRRTNEAYLLPRLTRLYLSDCSRVKCLPSLRHLPNLNDLTLTRMDELEYIQGDEEEEKLSPNAIFLPDLKKLRFIMLKKLKGWSRKVEEATRSKEEHAATCTPHALSFPSLLELTIGQCPELNHMLLCPSLGKYMVLHSVKAKVIHQLLLPIHGNSFPSNTTTPSSSLQSVVIENCHDLVSFPGESFTSLRYLRIAGCTKLNKVELAPLGSNILEELVLLSCPKLELWEENKRGVDWDSLLKLTKLTLEEVPSSEKLPDCLRKRQAHFRLTITFL